MAGRVAFLPHFIHERAKILEDVGIDCGKAEVEWILCHVLDVNRLALYMNGAELLTDEAVQRCDAIIDRRRERYPLQFILEESWFYGRRFYVNPSVMAPTPETEVLCERAIEFVNTTGRERARILDIGVGSGVISVTLMRELPGATAVALDISAEALEVARRNARDLEVADRIDFRQSDFFSAIDLTERFDLILSNPPYIREDEYPTLQKEVLCDPRIAMTSGHDGLDAIRAIMQGGPDHLAPDGRIMFEIGYGQADAIEGIFREDRRYSEIRTFRDLSGLDRIIMLSCQ